MSRPYNKLNADGTKKCSSCGQLKPSEAYVLLKWKTGSEGRRSECRSCQADKRERKKLSVFAYYTNGDIRCQCPGCSEREPRFLTIDHINNDGAEHRKTVGASGSQTYHWIIKNNFPPGLQVLCFNCNCAKGLYGFCPHQRTA